MVKERGSGMVVPALLLFTLVFGLISNAGCAITDSNHTATGGDSSVGANGSVGGAGATASGGAATDGACEAGSRRCAGDTPETCQSGGTWKANDACKVGQACSGAGVCADFRLVQAGIGTFGEQPAAPAGASLVLKEQTLTAAPRACSNDFCITGDLR
jgi:hypothetical protein